MLRRWLFFCFVFFLVLGGAARAHASSDRVSFLHDIEVSSGEEANDTVCFLCSIRVDGKVNGDTVAFLGSIHLNGAVEGDVVSFLGGVNMASDSSIGGSCVVFGGPLRRTGDTSIGGDTVQFPLILIMMPFIIFGLIIYGIVSFIRRRRYMAYTMPPPPLR